jgi:DNA-directed RNA polymerase I, II, and III subunit RPABC3
VQEELDVNGDEEDEDAPKKVKRELWRSEDQGLAADYEYVMYGKVSFFVRGGNELIREGIQI